jgi:hypothetical protein
MGGKVHVYCMDYITHVGEYQYCGRFWDELQASAKSIKHLKIALTNQKKSHKV